MNSSFYVPSISCSKCCNKITDSISGMSGVANVACDFVSKTVNVDYDESQVNASSIKNKVSSMGYEVE